LNTILLTICEIYFEEIEEEEAEDTSVYGIWFKWSNTYISKEDWYI